MSKAQERFAKREKIMLSLARGLARAESYPKPYDKAVAIMIELKKDFRLVSK